MASLSESADRARITPGLGLVLIALSAALATGCVFSARIISTDVPLLFFWALAGIAVLFILSWYLADAEAQAMSMQGFGLFAAR